MGGNVAEVAVAALLFVGSHFLLSSAAVRAPLSARLGEAKFLILYSVVALCAFVWLVTAYGAAPSPTLWGDGGWARAVVLVLMLPATVLLVCGFAVPSPTVVVVPTQVLPRAEATGIHAITRHPVLWAIALWAACHLLVNGDVASILFFGALLILALGGMAHIDSRRREAGLEHWPAFAEMTSALPFAAILEGRNRWANARVPWPHPVIGVAVYVALLALHGTVIGRDPLP